MFTKEGVTAVEQDHSLASASTGSQQRTAAQLGAVRLTSITDHAEYLRKAEELLERGDSNEIITSLPMHEALQHLKSVVKVYSDFDGTIIDPGETVLTERTKRAIEAAYSAGVDVIGVTGKPFAEISDLLDGLPQNFPLGILFEKGAFILERDLMGAPRKEFLLATEAAAQATAEVKNLFQQKWKDEIETLLNTSQPRVRLELAGTGTHECVFSLDVLDPNLAPAGDGFMSVAGGRDSIKVHDPDLIEIVKQEFNRRIHTIPGFERSKAVDLGNSNIEWAPDNTTCRIEKDLGVAAHAGFAVSEDPNTGAVTISASNSDRTVSILGDSGNDKPLFALGQSLQNFKGMLVYHNRTPKDMVQNAHFIVAGITNGAAFLELIAAAKDI